MGKSESCYSGRKKKKCISSFFLLIKLEKDPTANEIKFVRVKLKMYENVRLSNVFFKQFSYYLEKKTQKCFSYLMRQVGAELQHPVPPLLHGHAHTPPAVHGDGAQRVVLRQLDHQLDEDVVNRIGGDDFSGCLASFHLRETGSVQKTSPAESRTEILNPGSPGNDI